MTSEIGVNKFTIWLMIVPVIVTLIGGVYGFAQWIDNRYISTERHIYVGVTTAVTIYNQRIIDLEHFKKFLIEHEPERTEMIIFLSEEIQNIKNNRSYFLKTGHYTTGDDVYVNPRTIEQVFK